MVMVSGKKCMIQAEASLCVLDSSNNEFKTPTLTYKEKVMWDEACAFGEEKTIVPVQGSDNKKYIVIVDGNGELLLEPP